MFFFLFKRSFCTGSQNVRLEQALGPMIASEERLTGPRPTVTLRSSSPTSALSQGILKAAIRRANLVAVRTSAIGVFLYRGAESQEDSLLQSFTAEDEGGSFVARTVVVVSVEKRRDVKRERVK